MQTVSIHIMISLTVPHSGVAAEKPVQCQFSAHSLTPCWKIGQSTPELCNHSAANIDKLVLTSTKHCEC